MPSPWQRRRAKRNLFEGYRATICSHVVGERVVITKRGNSEHYRTDDYDMTVKFHLPHDMVQKLNDEFFFIAIIGFNRSVLASPKLLFKFIQFYHVFKK